MSTENIDVEGFAGRLGFHLVSVIPYAPLKAQKPHLDKWLANGYAGDLEYMHKGVEKRTDPDLLLPGVQSVICLAMNYFQPFPPAPQGAHAKVARYAWGKDYHSVIEKKLKKIRNYIIEESAKANSSASGASRNSSISGESHNSSASSKLSKTDFKLCSDAGPILERAYAVKAGFGFIGKNGMLITKQYGSWVFLAEILVRAKLKYSQVPKIQGAHCGSCTRCLDACPAKAIIKPRVINAEKCLSYQTIENKKNSPPPNIRKNLNGWIFGCDMCQEVCPHNFGSKITDIPEFLNHRAGPYLNMQEIAEMTEKQFAEKFAGSPLKRAGLKKLKDTANYVNIRT